jgi:hypothetical protein
LLDGRNSTYISAERISKNYSSPLPPTTNEYIISLNGFAPDPITIIVVCTL